MAAHMRQIRNAHKIVVIKIKGKRRFWRTRHRLHNHIKRFCKEPGCENVNSIHLAQDKLALVNTVIYLLLPFKKRNVLTSKAATGFSWTILLVTVKYLITREKDSLQNMSRSSRVSRNAANSCYSSTFSKPQPTVKPVTKTGTTMDGTKWNTNSWNIQSQKWKIFKVKKVSTQIKSFCLLWSPLPGRISFL